MEDSSGEYIQNEACNKGKKYREYSEFYHMFDQSPEKKKRENTAELFEKLIADKFPEDDRN